MKNIAVIPARSGSKGLKDKNIKDLCGKPMIAYSIEAALDSGKFDVVHVSTDSEKYAEIAKEYGADVPFLRTPELATDTATSADAIIYSINRYREMGSDFDTIMILQPTSPLRTKDDIIKAYEIYKEKDAESVVSVCEVDHPPLWSNTLSDSGSMESFSVITAGSRRQDLKQYYRLNGSIYLTTIEKYLSKESLYNNRCFAYVMPKDKSVDIDDAFDFLMAESIMRAQ